METLIIKLKQHTPLIHFQHDQDGATLRASEVKPKLDKFILTRLGNGDYQAGIEQAKIRGWLIGKGDNPALNYKLKIDSSDVEIWDINNLRPYTDRHAQLNKPFLVKGEARYLAKTRNTDRRLIFDLEQYPLFFANLDKDYNNPDEYKRYSFVEAPLNLTFLFRDSSLVSIVSDADTLNDFFFQNNFGTRQSKGFGSFYLDITDPLYRSRQSQYKFTLNPSKLFKKGQERFIEDEFKLLFERIELLYKSLRGGINLKDRQHQTIFYFKSLLFKYADTVLDAKWDKRKVKEVFYHIPSENRTNTFDMRDMLGYSTNEQWLSYHDSISKRFAVWNPATNQYVFPSINEGDVIERMQSPILIKPFYDENHDVYHIHILTQEDKVNLSEFQQGAKVCIYSKAHNSCFMIDLPVSFSTKEFLDYAFSDIDIDEHIETRFHSHPYYSILSDIYKQIQANSFL